MTTIIVFEGVKKILSKIIINQLTPSYRITYICRDEISCCGNGYDILLVDGDKVTDINLEECLVVLDEQEIPPELSLAEKCIIIANSDNKKQMNSLKNTECHVLACGQNNKSTYSYSSLSDEDILISLNRKIVALSGRTIEPVEFPYQLLSDDIYQTLALAAIRMLLDDNRWDIEKLY